MNEYGTRLKKLRSDYGLTMDVLVEQLNEKFGTSLNKGMISKWENGKEDASMPNIIVVAKYFNVSIDFLLGIEEVSTQKDNTIQMASEISINPKLRILFDETRELEEHDIDFILTMVERLKKNH